MSRLLYTPLDVDSVKAELLRLGHFHAIFDGHAKAKDVKSIDKNANEFAAAVLSFQQYSGLDVVDGELGPLTLATLTTRQSPDGSIRVCGCPDIEAAGDGEEAANIDNGTRTWPDPERPIVFAYDFDTLPGLSKADTQRAYKAALADINSKIGVNLVLGRWSDAHVRIRLKGLGGGTLAIALLSTGSRAIGSHYQNYDSSNRRWYYDLAQEVIAHETGHTLGFSHSRDSSAVMYPTASGRKVTWQRDDINRGVRAYGPPRSKPDEPTPEPDAPADVEGMLKVGSTFYRITGTQSK